MRHLIATLLMVVPAATGGAQVVEEDRSALERVYLDAEVLHRVAEVARRDIPRDILQRIIEQDIEMLRGRIDDSRYRYAHFEPIDAGVITEGFSVRADEDGRYDRTELRARNVHAVRIKVPSRRMLISRNADVYVESIQLEYSDIRGVEKAEKIPVDRLIESGESWQVPFPEVAADAVVTVFARGEGKRANMELELVRSQLVDDASSPYFGAVQNAKLLREAVDRRDASGIQSLARTLANRVQALLGRSDAEVEAVVREADQMAAAVLEGPEVLEIYLELERIEDLMRGTDEDRVEGLERLREVNRRLREIALRR